MISTSAPGKILLVGGYSVLEKPNISFVCAVNARVHAYLTKRNDEKVFIEMPQFKIKKETNELDEEEKKCARFVLSAIDAVQAYFKYKKKKLSGFEIKTISDAAFSVNSGKSGIGSSAAVTVAVISALLTTKNLGKNSELVHKLSQYAHAIAQGKIGSGFDIASAVYGTIKYVRYSPSKIDARDISKIDSDWDYEIEKTEWPKNFHIVVGNFIGKSTSTGEIVKKVMEFKKAKPAEYFALIKELNSENEKAIANIGHLEKFKEHFNNGRILTKKLGEFAGAEIESWKNTKLIERLMQDGAYVAKLPGAGGGDSICIICLSKNDGENVKEILGKLENIQILDIKIENNGYRVE